MNDIHPAENKRMKRNFRLRFVAVVMNKTRQTFKYSAPCIFIDTEAPRPSQFSQLRFRLYTFENKYERETNISKAEELKYTRITAGDYSLNLPRKLTIS